MMKRDRLIEVLCDAVVILVPIAVLFFAVRPLYSPAAAAPSPGIAIHATVPSSASIQAIADQLRDAAIAAGCLPLTSSDVRQLPTQAGVAIRMLERARGIEISVECEREEGAKP